MRPLLCLSMLAVGGAGCSGPEALPPREGNGVLWGHVTLARREGVKPVKKDDPVYADKRLGDLEMVDYRRPGFCVVHVRGTAPTTGALAILKRSATGEPRFGAAGIALGAGGKLRIRNEDDAPHIMSWPEAGLIQRVAAGDEVQVPATTSGPGRLFALDLPSAETAVFVAPGPFSVAAEDGRWELRDLPPGETSVAVWHPRFPGTTRQVQVVAGNVRREDFELRVEHVSDQR
jgi:hypothetical protein